MKIIEQMNLGGYIMNSFPTLSIIALLCYLFLFLAMLASQKNKVIDSFLRVLITMLLWTGGSFMMRIQVEKLFSFGYHLSFLGLCLMPFTIYDFFARYLCNGKCKTAYYWLWIFIAIFLINIETNFFLAQPSPQLVGDQMLYVYDITIGTFILLSSFLVFVIYSTVKLVKIIRQKREVLKELIPIFAGIIILLGGNIIVVLPIFDGYPIDILAGVCNALCMFYALYRRRMFKLTLLVSRANCYVLAGTIASMFFFHTFTVLKDVIMHIPGLSMQQVVMIMSIAFTIVTTLLYIVLKSFIDHVFIKDEIRQNENVKDFSSKISKTLNQSEIIEDVAHMILDTIAMHNLYICLEDENKDFSIVYGNTPFSSFTQSFNKENPLVLKAKMEEEVFMYSKFKRSTAYRTMWEKEKQQCDRLEVEMIVPIHSEYLVGMILIGKKNNGTHYHYHDVNFLTSIASICAIALNNAKMYEKVYMEARIDELTGLHNRKYFYEKINELYDIYKDKGLTLILVSVDDVRLYNQLYGNKEGDKALINIAAIIKNFVETHGSAARLGGKEFAILLPQFNLMEAQMMAEMIRESIAKLSAQEGELIRKSISASFGISSIPYLATTIDQLMDYANLALYQAKRSGKNCVYIYNKTIANEKEKDRQRKKASVYSEYAQTIYALTAAIDTKDHYTFTHSSNVAYYASALGSAYGLNEDVVEILKEAALLHDVGKIGISEHILNKKGRLDEDEFIVMKSHVDASIGIIRHLPSLDYVIPAVISHHERYDGKGYPRGIAKEDIPLLGRILCVADSFDAMTSSRSYKESYSLEYSMNELEKNKGTQFDPHLVDVFLDLLKEEKISVQGNRRLQDKIIS